MIIINHLKATFFSKKESSQSLNNPLNKVPKDLQLEILSFFSPFELIKFSKISKACKRLAENPRLWKIFVNQIGITNLSITPKKDFSFGWIMYSKLNLKEKCGEEICRLIEQMNIWEPSIKFSENGKSIHFYKQFPKLMKEGSGNHFYKKIIQSDLYLILIPENRSNASVIKFNSNFSKQLSPKRRKLYCPPLSGNMPVAYITGSNDGSRS